MGFKTENMKLGDRMVEGIRRKGLGDKLDLNPLLHV